MLQKVGLITAGELKEIERGLRELAYHPERSLDGAADGRVATLVRRKQQWIETVPTRETAKLRCREIHAVNQALQPWVAHDRERLARSRETTATALRSQGILASRDYAFCLYPAEPLRRLMELP